MKKHVDREGAVVGRDQGSQIGASAPTATATGRCSPPGRKWPERLWTVEAVRTSAGISRRGWSPTANRSRRCRRSCPRGLELLHRPRVEDPVATDAHLVAVVALRTPGLRVVQADNATVAFRLLVGRRGSCGSRADFAMTDQNGSTGDAGHASVRSATSFSVSGGLEHIDTPRNRRRLAGWTDGSVSFRAW